MKKYLNIVLIIFFISFINYSCSNDKPMLKKPLNKCTSKDLLEYGRSLFNAGYYRDAIREYRKVIGTFPDNKNDCAWAQYELAYSYYYMGEYKIALREFKKVKQLYPEVRGAVILAQKMIKKILVNM